MHKEMTKLLRMNLQHFAEQQPEQPEESTETNTEGDPAETPEVDQPENTEQGEDKTFTQADIDKIVTERLARERKKHEESKQAAEAEAERKRLEEAEEYKQLAETYKSELETIKGDALVARKDAALSKAGYTDEQIELLRNTVNGETNEEILEAVKALQNVIAPKPTYVDPNTNNGGRQKPAQVDGREVGISAFERIKNKIR